MGQETQERVKNGKSFCGEIEKVNHFRAPGLDGTVWKGLERGEPGTSSALAKVRKGRWRW